MSEKDDPDVLPADALAKARTGIVGLDEITQGGLPAGRPTLVCGGPGSGKTVLAMEFLVRGASEFGEPGAFVSFEESRDDLCTNFQSLGFDTTRHIQEKRLAIVDFVVARAEVVETGDFSLDGLLLRLEQSITQLGAKRVAIDTIETLFANLTDTQALRRELGRLFRWLRDRGVTAIVTAERGEGALTQHGIEEYVSDCVMLLDHRVAEGVSKRRLRVVKYRGSAHSADEFPFLIGATGITVMPVSSVGPTHEACTERVSTGVKHLDAMLGGKGYYRGSNILVSGAAGLGKSSLAAAFAAATSARGERCLYLSFEEESSTQLIRNMRSVGIDLGPEVARDLLRIHAVRPTLFGLEEHLVAITCMVDAFKPHVVVMDPITDFMLVGSRLEIRSMLTRVLNYLQRRQITTLVTHLRHGGDNESENTISSLIDTLIVITSDPKDLSHRRLLRIVKSRGMDHLRQTHELAMSKHGISVNSLTAKGDGNSPAAGEGK